jgi:hypothetical protein
VRVRNNSSPATRFAWGVVGCVAGNTLALYNGGSLGNQPGCAANEIAVRVEHSSIQMFDITITFGDGTTFSPPTRLIFTPDTATRTIDLPGDARIIRRVDFHYANLPGGGRAQVELWAR